MVLRSSSDKAFIAGTDISQFADFTDGEEGVAYEEKIARITNRLEDVERPDRGCDPRLLRRRRPGPGERLRPAGRHAVGAVRAAHRPDPGQLPVDEQLLHPHPAGGPVARPRHAAAGPAAHRRGGARLGVRGRALRRGRPGVGDATASCRPCSVTPRSRCGRPRRRCAGSAGRPSPRATTSSRGPSAARTSGALSPRSPPRSRSRGRAGDRRRGRRSAGRHRGARPLAGARRAARRHDARRHGCPGDQGGDTRTGDDSRGWGPPFVGPEDEPVSTYYLSANRNKESVRLDLKTQADSATLGGAGGQGRRAHRELPPRRARPARLPGQPAGRASTRGSWCCRSAGSGTTVPRAAAPATTRSPRARAG